MKAISTTTAYLLLFLSACNAQEYPDNRRETMMFPKDSALLNIKDSILIGKYFVAVKGNFYSNFFPTNPLNSKVYVPGYEHSEEISLKDLKQTFKLISSDSLHPVSFGNVALLKIKNAAASTNYYINIRSQNKLAKIEILEEGDIIAFVGMQSSDGKKLYTFPARWYKIVK